MQIQYFDLKNDSEFPAYPQWENYFRWQEMPEADLWRVIGKGGTVLFRGSYHGCCGYYKSNYFGGIRA